jgi:hypothetical protein
MTTKDKHFPYKIATGIAYVWPNHEFKEERNEKLRDRSEFKSQKDYWLQPALTLEKESLLERDTLSGLPVFNAHKNRTGEILSSWVEGNKLMITCKISDSYNKTPFQERILFNKSEPITPGKTLNISAAESTLDVDTSNVTVVDKIESGEYASFSIRYTKKFHKGFPIKTCAKEVSVCKNPLFEDCKIIISAARDHVEEGSGTNKNHMVRDSEEKLLENARQKPKAADNPIPRPLVKEKINNSSLNTKTKGNDNIKPIKLSVKSVMEETTQNNTGSGSENSKGDSIPRDMEGNQTQSDSNNDQNQQDSKVNSTRNSLFDQMSRMPQNTGPEKEKEEEKEKEKEKEPPKNQPKSRVQQDVISELEKYKQMAEELTNKVVGLEEAKKNLETEAKSSLLKENEENIDQMKKIWMLSLSQEELSSERNEDIVNIFTDKDQEELATVFGRMLTDLRELPSLYQEIEGLREEIQEIKSNNSRNKNLNVNMKRDIDYDKRGKASSMNSNRLNLSGAFRKPSSRYVDPLSQTSSTDSSNTRLRQPEEKSISKNDRSRMQKPTKRQVSWSNLDQNQTNKFMRAGSEIDVSASRDNWGRRDDEYDDESLDFNDDDLNRCLSNYEKSIHDFATIGLPWQITQAT